MISQDHMGLYLTQMSFIVFGNAQKNKQALFYKAKRKLRYFLINFTHFC